jgi:transcriptional regulator with XRE-family HTH domain
MGRSRDEELLDVMPQLLRDARGRKGVSQEQLADLAGVDRTVVSRLESGRRLPSLAVFIALAYGVDETPPQFLERALKLVAKAKRRP